MRRSVPPPSSRERGLILSILDEAANVLRGRVSRAIGEGGWPSSGDNDMAERNLTHAFASAAEDHGYTPLFEVKSNNGRIDAVLVNKKAKRVICVESKLLYSLDGKIAEVVKDVGALLKSSAASQLGLEGMTERRAILCSSWLVSEERKRLHRTRSSALAAFGHGGGAGLVDPRDTPGLTRLKELIASLREEKGALCSTARACTSGDEVQYLALAYW